MSEKTRRGLWLNWREGGYMEDVGMDGRIILIWIMKKYNGRARTGCV